jgi:chitinase
MIFQEFLSKLWHNFETANELIKFFFNSSLDMIHLMAYDFNGAWDAQTGANAAMRPGPMDITPLQLERNNQAVVNFWLSRGAPANKLILGVPFYGRTFNLVSGNNGVGAPSSGGGPAGPYTQESGFLGYHEICTNLGSKWVSDVVELKCKSVSISYNKLFV